MKRQKLILSGLMLAGFILALLGGLGYLAKSPPAFYAAGHMPSGEDRENLARKFKQAFSEFRSSMVDDEPVWKALFTTDQINAFFQEDFIRAGSDSDLPPNFYEPRVAIEDNKLRLAVRYGSGLTSTILSLELKLWLVSGETNMLAVEIVGLSAGKLPLSTSTLLDYITALARKENIDVTWYRHEGHPVAIMRFVADQTRPTFQLVRVELRNKELMLEGKSTQAANPTVVNRP